MTSNQHDPMAGAVVASDFGEVRPDAVATHIASHVLSMDQLPDWLIRRFWGALVVAGKVIYYMFRARAGNGR